jgi:DNA invertase Pin-like site-specific DNA recombinase
VKRAALYVRVSTEDQVEHDTLQNQLDFGHRWAALHEIDIMLPEN